MAIAPDDMILSLQREIRASQIKQHGKQAERGQWFSKTGLRLEVRL